MDLNPRLICALHVYPVSRPWLLGTYASPSRLHPFVPRHPSSPSSSRVVNGHICLRKWMDHCVLPCEMTLFSPSFFTEQQQVLRQWDQQTMVSGVASVRTSRPHSACPTALRRYIFIWCEHLPCLVYINRSSTCFGLSTTTHIPKVCSKRTVVQLIPSETTCKVHELPLISPHCWHRFASCLKAA